MEKYVAQTAIRVERLEANIAAITALVNALSASIAESTEDTHRAIAALAGKIGGDEAAAAPATTKTQLTPGSVVSTPTEKPKDDVVHKFGSRVGGAFDGVGALGGGIGRTGLRG